MKNFKQIAFGLLVGAMAIDFSAFTSGPEKLAAGQFRFYNISGVPGDQTASNFVYRGGTDALCDANLSTECSAVWTVDNTPSTGQSPDDAGSPNYEGITHTGDFNP